VARTDQQGGKVGAKLLGVTVTCFTIVLGVALSIQIGPEAVGIVVGVICGVAFSVPISAILLLTIGKRTGA
jgi:hypothetical protein